MKKLVIVITIISGILFTSCEKSNTDNGTNNGSGTGKVYAVGYLNRQGYYDLPRTAKLWVDAVETSLTDGTKDAMAIGIFLSGADVYVAGYESNGSNTVAKLWKNGVAQNLSDGTKYAEATSVYVDGADVYVAGSQNKILAGIEYSEPIVWKNGVATNLPLTDNTKTAKASSVVVIGSDVYVAGVESLPDNSNKIAKLWKNGVASVISSSSTLKECRVMVTRLGNDLYTGCFEQTGLSLATASFTLQKNGTITTTIPNFAIPNDGTASDVKSQMPFAVSNSDVYFAGNISTGLAVLKNGIDAPALKGTNMLGYTSIATLGNDVYVGGMKADNTYIGHAAYIKNGVTTILNNASTRNSNLLGIAVKN